MALTTSGFRESPIYQGFYDTVFLSTYALELKPQTLGKLQNRYGIGLSMNSFANLAGRVMPVKSPTITIFEQGAPRRPVKVSIALDAAPVNLTTVTADVADGSDAYLRQFDNIIIPAEYTNKTEPQEMRITGSAGAWKGTFAKVDAAITTALDSVYVAVGATSFGKGSTQPDSRAKGAYSRTTNERIIKDTKAFEGATIYQERWEEFEVGNSKGLWSEAVADLDFEMDNQKDAAILAGQVITNTAGITQLSITGDTKAVPSAEGLDEIIASLGQELTWDATGFGFSQYRAMRPLLENVGVVNMKLDLFCGSDLNSSIEAEMIDILSTNAGGTKYWDEIQSVGFMVNQIKLDGVQTNVAVLHSLSDPNKYGLSSYPYKKSGYLFTQGEYKVTMQDGNGVGESLRMPHLTLGYPEGNGENRQRVIKALPGMNGISGMGGFVASPLDGVYLYAMEHFIPIWTGMYQTIKINYDATEGGGA